MAVNRVIFRWDFPICAAVFDVPGSILVTLADALGWDAVNEARNQRTFSLKKDHAEHQQTFSFSPQFVVCGVEWKTGVPISKLTESREFADLLQMMDEFKRMAKISTLNRCGFRLYHLSEGSFSEDEKAGSAILESMISSANGHLVTFAKDVLGAPSDLGVILTGSNEDGTSYTARFGPYFAGEHARHFDSVVPEEFLPAAAFLCDIDFWEQSFEMTVSSKVWARQFLPRAEKFITLLEREVGAKRHGSH